MRINWLLICLSHYIIFINMHSASASAANYRTLNICKIVSQMHLQPHLQLLSISEVNEHRKEQRKNITVRVTVRHKHSNKYNKLIVLKFFKFSASDEINYYFIKWVLWAVKRLASLFVSWDVILIFIRLNSDHVLKLLLIAVFFRCSTFSSVINITHYFLNH